MPSFSQSVWSVLLGGLALQTIPLFAQEPRANEQNLFPGISATATQTPFPGIVPSPIGHTPLAASPTVLALEHLSAAQMSNADQEVVSHLRAELSREAALANFDISQPAWHYEQVVCPAFPDYVFLAFGHGADEEGSSRFTAILPRDSAEVHIISTYAHGLLPFEASWNRPGSFEVFNGILRQERGRTPLSYAPNWLLIGICYAELSGYPVQVLSTLPLPDLTLDLLRLNANRPQMVIGSNQSAHVTFSDVSRPNATTNWDLGFNHEGELTSANRAVTRQPATIALKP
jgi:hypothetical protein